GRGRSPVDGRLESARDPSGEVEAAEAMAFRMADRHLGERTELPRDEGPVEGVRDGLTDRVEPGEGEVVHHEGRGRAALAFEDPEELVPRRLPALAVVEEPVDARSEGRRVG